MECLADRFVREEGRWIDAATGAFVRIHFEPATPLDAFDWDAQCERLFNARHPLLNPLIDYGVAPGGQRFEAYASAAAARASGADAERQLRHVTTFLRTAGVSLTAPRSRCVMRALEAGRWASGRSVGFVLQPRRTLDVVRDTLETPASAPSLIDLIAPPLAGLRTARMLIARTARILGFVPVCAGLLLHKPALRALIRERHLCVLVDDGPESGRDLANVLVAISAASARRHVVVRFARVRGRRRAITLDPLSIRALVGMVIADPDDGPSEQELFDAARAAEGRPGAFLTYLAAGGSALRGAMAVHETPQEYGPEDPAPSRSVPAPPRTLSTALRATARAAALAARGRHAAARRVLERGARVLAGRGCGDGAADCLLLAGQLALDRGRTTDAARLFADAQRHASAGPLAVRSGIGLGHTWIEDVRLVEAEAVLRGAASAAETIGDGPGTLAALAGLVRCLVLQERPADAIGAAAAADWAEGDDAAPVPLLAELSRAHAALGRTAVAIRLARRSHDLGSASSDPRLIAMAELALAEAFGAAGDTAGMRERLQRAREAARQARLPLLAIRAELAWCENASEDVPSNARRLRALQRLALPRQLRERAASVPRPSTRTLSLPDPARESHREAADALESLLQVAQKAADDGAALQALCVAAAERLRAASVVAWASDRRVLACEGRPWATHSTALEQTLLTQTAAASDPGLEPREAAEPVRYGGEVIGLVGARWTAGAAIDTLGCAAILRALGMAIAAPMRAVLDRAITAPPSALWNDLLGDSPAATVLRDAVLRAARAPFPVLIEGESGCGKELVARAIHRLGSRRERKFCPLNCAALTDELVEAELFGHARGAFTGAASERAGLFEEADGGTLFLDEVGELSARAQAKLLRVLQEGEVRRVGENFSRRVDTRIVAATNRRLDAEVSAGRFRADLRFRLDVVRLSVPSLRERPGDIPILATHFWQAASKSVGSQATFTADTLAALARYDWPGNVRELQNVIAWIAVHSPRRGRIGPSALPAHVARSAAPAACTLDAARDEFERRFVRAALATANGQRARAAEALGITRQGLAKMIRRLGIDA